MDIVSRQIVKQFRGAALVGLLAVSILPQSLIIEGVVASAITLSVFGIAGAIFSIAIVRNIINDAKTPEWLSRPPLFSIVAVLILASIYIGHVVAGNYYDLTNAVSAIAIVGVVTLNLFIIPQIVPERSFLAILSRFSAALVISSIIILMAVSLGYLSPDLLWQNATTVGSVRIPYLRSLTSNPNTVGQLSFTGTIAALYEIDKKFSRGNAVLLMVNSVGLFFTASQASWLATIVAFAIYAAYRSAGKQGVTMMSFSILLAAVLSLLTAVFLYQNGMGITLSGRLILWEATVQAIQENLLFGYGHTYSGSIIRPYVNEAVYIGDATHNSYLRIALISGIVGFISYLVLVFGSIYNEYRAKITNIGIFSIACGFLVIQLFESYSLFGFTSHSVVNTLVVGYLLLQNDVSKMSAKFNQLS